jgi:hypothetical protein
MQLAAKRLGHHRRGRGDDANAENQDREVQVDAKGSGGQRGSTNAAQHDHICRGQRDLREVGEDQRPTERQGGPEFSEPNIARECAMASVKKHGGFVINTAIGAERQYRDDGHLSPCRRRRRISFIDQRL